MRMLAKIIVTISLAISISASAQGKRSGSVGVNDSVKLHYQFYGHGKDTVIISDVGWISPYLKDYDGKLTLLVFDVRDRGKSRSLKTNRAISIQDNLTDVEAVRKHFGIHKINLAGWSYMGAMAAFYAERHPDNVSSVVLLSPMPISKKATARMASSHTDLAAYRMELDDFVAKNGKDADPVKYARLFWRSMIAPSVHDLNNLDKLVDGIPKDVNEQPANVLSNLGAVFDKFGDWNFDSTASKVQCRTLVMYGVSDSIPVESSVEWATAIPGSRSLQFSQSGHYIFAEETEKWLLVMEAFFAGGWPEGAVEPAR